MKKLFFIICLLLILSCWAEAMSVGSSEAEVRTGPGFGYDSKATFPPHHPIRVIDKEGEWYKVTDWLNNTGWINRSDLSNSPTCIVKKIKVNLRAKPSTSSAKLETLYKGFILKILKVKGAWYQVRSIDPPMEGIGWVNKKLVWGD